MRGVSKWPSYLIGLIIGMVSSIASLKAEVPVDWQINFQEPATPVMEKLVAFHDLILWVQFGICALVGALILYIVIQFRSSKNKMPSKTTHNSLLEVVWTIFPVVILLVIAFPSLRLLYFMDVTPEAQMTVKAIGNQWYWTYEYPDEGISFDSLPLEGDDLQPGQLRLFEVDKRVVVPVNTTVRIITTSNDVIHSWAIPAFGVKKDSVPGRLNETWFKVTKEGTYYGQCSELCGAKHGFMPIVVDVVSPARYKHWVAQNNPTPAEAPVSVEEPTPESQDAAGHEVTKTLRDGEITAVKETDNIAAEKTQIQEKTKEIIPEETKDSSGKGVKENISNVSQAQPAAEFVEVKTPKTGEGK